MLSLRRMGIDKAQPNTATLARERLLRDREMRRNKPSHALSPLPAPPITAAFPLLAARPGRRFLTPPEQRQQVIQIARNFRSHYLANITYLDDIKMTVAVVRPTHARRKECDGPHEICVDAAGNVSVSRCNLARPSRWWPVLSRMLVVVSVVLTALGALSLVS